MNAYTTETYDQSYSAAPPVLIAGDSDAALQRAARTVEAAGGRIGAILPLDGAADRIALQAAASAVWIELDHDGRPAMDRLLRQVRMFWTAAIRPWCRLPMPWSIYCFAVSAGRRWNW